MTIKPYILNNYEGKLPAQPRGYYRSYPTSTSVQNKAQEKINGVQITVDLSNVKDKNDVCERFYNKLGFDVNKQKLGGNWDSLGDYLWFFPESSAVFTEIDPAVVNLKVLNINHLWKVSEKDYSILCEILTTTTDNSRFDNGFRMIVEATND